MTVTRIPDPPLAPMIAGADPVRVAGGATATPAPPAASMQTRDDPAGKGGGVFDGDIFDGFRPNWVFDTEGYLSHLSGDPAVVEMVTLPDPVTA